MSVAKIVIALLGLSGAKSCTSQYINGVQFAEPPGAQLGLSKITFPEGVEGTAKCGITSKFWGRQDDGFTVEGRVVSDISPKTLCNENITDVILLWPNRVRDFRNNEIEDYPCLERFDEQNGHFFLDFYVKRRLKGIIFAGDIPNYVSSLGFLYTSDLGFSKSAYQNLGFFIFECAFPADWEDKLISKGQNYSTFGSFTMESDLAFRKVFTSRYHFFLYTIFIPLAHLFVAVYGVLAWLMHFQNLKRNDSPTRLKMIVIAINVLTCSFLAVVMFVEGWWRTGRFSSLFRDSLTHLFIGPLTGTGVIMVIIWTDYVENWRGGIGRMSKPFASQHRSSLKAMGILIVCIPTSGMVLIMSRQLRLVDMMSPSLGALAAVQFILVFFFITQSNKFAKLIVTIVHSKRNDISSQTRPEPFMLDICRLVRNAGYSLGYLTLSTCFMASGLPFVSSTAWSLVWFNYHWSRVLAGFSLIRVASKGKKFFNHTFSSRRLNKIKPKVDLPKNLNRQNSQKECVATSKEFELFR